MHKCMHTGIKGQCKQGSCEKLPPEARKILTLDVFASHSGWRVRPRGVRVSAQESASFSHPPSTANMGPHSEEGCWPQPAVTHESSKGVILHCCADRVSREWALVVIMLHPGCSWGWLLWKCENKDVQGRKVFSKAVYTENRSSLAIPGSRQYFW